MPYHKKETYNQHEFNILASEVGLVAKTRQALASDAVDLDGEKVIKAGSLWTDPDDATRIGIVRQNYSMEGYEKRPISVIVAGRVIADRISAEALAKKDEFAAQGLFIDKKED